VGHEGNTHYIAAEFLEGSTLSEVIAQQGGPLPLSRIVSFITQLASALDFAHQRGLVHRDIKPGNVFIGPDDHVTLMDFGIVKALVGGPQMTRAGTMVGTPEYMSPEQAEGRSIDQRSDIYSLGVVLYQLLTGRVPFEADTPTGVILAHITKQPMPPSRLNPAIPRPVEAAVMRALAKRPEDRFATAGELAQAVVGAPTLAGPLPKERSSGGTLKWLLLGGLGAAAVIALICFVSFGGLVAIGLLVPTSTPTRPPLSRITPAVTLRPPTQVPPSGDVLFSDDFSSEQASKDKEWVFESGDTVDYVWSANRLTIAVKKVQWLGWDTPAGDYDDFGAEIEAQAAGSDYAEYGIIFRLSGTGDTRSYYAFGVSTDGNYFMNKRLNNQWVNPKPVPTAASKYIKQGTAKNVLRALAEGSKISLYVNSFLVATVTDDSIASGKVGVYAGTGDNNQTQVYFSRVTILTAQKARATWAAQ
jgi:hypothetical protein